MKSPRSEFNFPIQLIRSPKRRKTMSVQVTPNGVLVRVPERLAERVIWDWLHEKLPWIERELARFPAQAQEPGEKSNWVDQHVYVRGEPLLLHYTQVSPKADWDILIDNDRLCVRGPAMHLNEPSVRQALIRWLRDLATKELIPRTESWSRELGYHANNIRVKTQHTRWGSCSSKGNVNLNWRLIQVPVWVMDYVIVHELCHLQELNHSARFWRLVATALPSYPSAVTWLRQHEVQLQLP